MLDKLIIENLKKKKKHRYVIIDNLEKVVVFSHDSYFVANEKLNKIINHVNINNLFRYDIELINF